MPPQRAALAEVEHRPWPLPDRPWLMGQTWHDLLFAHSALPAEALEPLIPEPLCAWRPPLLIPTVEANQRPEGRAARARK